MDANQEQISEAKKMPILDIAWMRYAQLDQAAEKQVRPHYRLRRWIAVLGVLATLLAVLVQTYPESFPALGKVILKVMLIIAPLVASGLAAFYNHFYGNGSWLVLRAGAEEIKKEIYNFRTVLKNDPRRRIWLEQRLADIQRQVYRGLGGELVLAPYKGEIPPYYDPSNPNSDPGFHDLTGEEYFTYRLEDQLAWHIGKNNRIQAERISLRVAILVAGAAGSLLAALGGTLALWVAVTASIAAALFGWVELRNLDATLKNYSKVIVELMIVSDHWKNLEYEERTNAEFFKTVKGTEKVLWDQNVEYIRSMQEAIADADLDEAELIDDVLNQAVASDKRMKQKMRDSIVDYTGKSLREAEEKVTETFEEALGTIAEEASSDLVQQELAAMREAAEQAVENIVNRASKVRAALDELKSEFGHIDFNAETPASELHAMMKRMPKTGEIKG
jgi:hypothetical protein